MRSKKTFRVLCGGLLLTGALLGLMACQSKPQENPNDTPIVFELEGGVYRNCTKPVIHYYPESEEPFLVQELTAVSGKDLTRSGYTFEGWYRTRIQNGDSVEYADKWDFAVDTVGEEGVTLYAAWKKQSNYFFELCYRDEATGEVVSLKRIDAEAGAKLNPQYIQLYGKRTGYARRARVYDEAGNPFDLDTVHPGGEPNTTVQIFLEFIKGYKLVTTRTELLTALPQNGNILLGADIDMDGKEWSGLKSFKGRIEGDGFSIRNFRLSYDNTRNGLVDGESFNGMGMDGEKLLCIGLATSLEGAELSNLTISDFHISVDAGLTAVERVIIAPLAVRAEGTVLRNLTISGTYSLDKLHEGLDPVEDVLIAPDVFYPADRAGITAEGLSVTFDEQGS